MKKNLAKQTSTVILCLALSVLNFSCADSSPEIERVYHTLVYDFYDETLPPGVSLSVFIEPLSDERRVKELVLYFKDSGYTWNIDNPLVIREGDIQYFGFRGIVSPPDSELQEGRYEIRFYDLALRETSSYFFVEKIPSLKNADISSLRASGFRNKTFASECSIEQIAVYDILSNILYTGDRVRELETDERIKAIYPEAVSYRLFYKNDDNSTAVVLPEVQLYDKTDNASSGEADE